MKTTQHFLLLLIMSLLMAFWACKTPVAFQVLVNDQKVPGISVQLNSETAVTDDDGKCQFTMPKKVLNKPANVTLKSAFYDLKDTAKIQQLKKNNAVKINAEKSPLAMNYEKMRKEIDSIGDIGESLALAEEILKQVEKRVNEAVKKNPNSPIQDFAGIAKLRREEHNILIKNIEELNDQYRSTIADLERGRFDKKTYDELRKRFEDVKQGAKKFNTSVTDLQKIEGFNEQNESETFSSDILFPTGKYQLGDLNEEQKNTLNHFNHRVKDFINKHFSGENVRNLVISVTVIGYTDGIPVGNVLWKEIENGCNNPSERGDGNQCLSELRAKALADYLQNEFAQMVQFKVKIIGMGSTLAKENVENKALRKCEASFTIYPKNLQDRNFDKYKLIKSK